MDKFGQSRREFLGKSAALIAAAAIMPSALTSCAGGEKPAAAPAAAPADGKPNSTFNGVAIGAITYSWRDMPGGLENMIKYCKEANISNLELMGNDLETCLGAPANPRMAIMQEVYKRTGRTPGGPGGKIEFTPEEQAQMDKYAQDIAEWRKNLDIAKVDEIRQKLEAEGIFTHIVKTQPGANSTDEEIDYAFKLAKAMGVKCITAEASLEGAKRVAPFAEKYDMYYAMHNHMQYADPEFNIDEILAVSPKIMLNFDGGHFFGSTGRNPIEMLEKYHDRIFSMHIKDKTGPKTEPEANTNQVWGQGEMPLAEVLLKIQKEGWPIYCDIELEYAIKPWSNSVKEVKTCVAYARQILM